MDKIAFVGDLVEGNNQPWWVNNVSRGHCFKLGQRVRISCEFDPEEKPQNEAFSKNPYFYVYDLSWDCDGEPLYDVIHEELLNKIPSFPFLQIAAWRNEVESEMRMASEIAIYNLLNGNRFNSLNQPLSLEKLLYIMKETESFLIKNISIDEQENQGELKILPMATEVMMGLQLYVTTTYSYSGNNDSDLIYHLKLKTEYDGSRSSFFDRANTIPANVMLTNIKGKDCLVGIPI